MGRLQKGMPVAGKIVGTQLVTHDKKNIHLYVLINDRNERAYKGCSGYSSRLPMFYFDVCCQRHGDFIL